MALHTPTGAPRRRVLTDPEQIRQWAEARGGAPARVIGSGPADEVGRLRIAFPDDPEEEPLEIISWAEWFAILAEQRLALVVEQ
jgi:hypothetical protein